MGALLGRVGMRVAVAAGLVLVVIGIVAVARVASRSEPARPLPAAPDYTPPSVDSSAGDDAEVATTPSIYPDSPEVIAIASSFTKAWLRRDLSKNAWHSGIEPLSTPTLADSLEGVDPLSVPATRTTSEPTLVRRTEGFAEVTTTVDTGTLELTLIKADTRWLVDGVDWERA